MLRNDFEYSPAEMRIIRHFGMADICNRIAPHVLYGMMAHKAFLDNDMTPFSTMLRKCIKAIESGTPLRDTAEFDAMIEDT